MQTAQNLPEYVCATVGQPAFGEIAIRLRDLAAFLAAQGMQEPAEKLLAAYGILRARLAAGVPVKSG